MPPKAAAKKADPKPAAKKPGSRKNSVTAKPEPAAADAASKPASKPPSGSGTPTPATPVKTLDAELEKARAEQLAAEEAERKRKADEAAAAAAEEDEKKKEQPAETAGAAPADSTAAAAPAPEAAPAAADEAKEPAPAAEPKPATPKAETAAAPADEPATEAKSADDAAAAPARDDAAAAPAAEDDKAANSTDSAASASKPKDTGAAAETPKKTGTSPKTRWTGKDVDQKAQQPQRTPSPKRTPAPSSPKNARASPTPAKKQSDETPEPAPKRAPEPLRASLLASTDSTTTPAKQLTASKTSNGDDKGAYLKTLGQVAERSGSPMTALLCGSKQRRAPSKSPTADAAAVQPPMRHGPANLHPDSSPTKVMDETPDPQYVERILAEKRKAQEMRRDRRRREREKLKMELAHAEEMAAAAAKQRDIERQRREDELRDRLDHLRDKKAQRELEFLISERRAQQVKHSKSLADVIQERFDAEVRAEEEQRQAMLRERREKLHAPVVSGLEAVQRHFDVVQERKARKDAQLKERQAEIAQRQLHPYQGSSYDLAVEEFIKSKHSTDDAKHQRLYKHAKMQEYGNLVKRLYGPRVGDGMSSGFDVESRRSPTRSTVPTSVTPQPFVTGAHQDKGGAVTPVVPKAAQPLAERNKMGNQYLRDALTEKKALPPGLKLAPIEDPRDKDHERFKNRKQLGDTYLRAVRELPHRAHSQALPERPTAEGDEAWLDEMRRLKARTAQLENRLHHAGNLEDPEAALEGNEQYLEVVRLKLEMLSKCRHK